MILGSELQIRGGNHIIFFLFLHKKICCRYSLEAPQRGACNEYPLHRFPWSNEKIISTFRTDLYLIWIYVGWSTNLVVSSTQQEGDIDFGVDPIGVSVCVSITFSCLHNILWSSHWILPKFSWLYSWAITKNWLEWWPNFQGHSSKKNENSQLGDISFLWKHCYWFLYACLKKRTYYVTGAGICKLFLFKANFFYSLHLIKLKLGW